MSIQQGRIYQGRKTILNQRAQAAALSLFSLAVVFQEAATAQDVEQNNYFASGSFVGLTPSEPITFQAKQGGAIQASLHYTGAPHQPCAPWLMLKAPSGKVLTLSPGDNAIPAAASNLKEGGTYSLIGMNANVNALLNSKVACPFDIQLVAVPGDPNQTGVWLSPTPPTGQPSGSVLNAGDIHQWKFNAAKNDQVSLSLKIEGPAYFGPYVYVVDPDGGYVAGQWGAPYANFKANKSGTYTAIVLNTQFDRPLSGHYSVLLSGVSASSIVEFGGPEVKLQNLWLRSAKPPAHLAKSAVVFCTSGNQKVHLPDYLSARSIKSPLTWSTAEMRYLEDDSLTLSCPSVDSASIVTVTGTSAANPTLSDTIAIILVPKQTEDEFKRWYAREAQDTSWFAELPCLPPTFQSSINAGWEKSPGSEMNNYHPGAKNDRRSPRTPTGHGHQATYDENAKLIVSANCPMTIPDGVTCISAGTADKVSPTTSKIQHKENDVIPFVWAAQLDSNPLETIFLGLDLSAPPIRFGEHLSQYFQIRPTIAKPAGVCP